MIDAEKLRELVQAFEREQASNATGANGMAAYQAGNLLMTYMMGNAPAILALVEREGKYREALEKIGAYGDGGICPYGCDCPHIAKAAMGGEGAGT